MVGLNLEGAENEGCTCSSSAHAAMDNIVDKNSTDSDLLNDSDSDSSSSGEDVNAQRWGFRLQISRSMPILLLQVYYMILNLHTGMHIHCI